jgi:hypothetical protein
MDLDRYAGKRFGLVLTDENDDTVVFGDWVASISGQTLLLTRPGGEMRLESEWLERIRPLDTPESREIIPDADYWLPLKVGPNPQEEETDIPTGMTWPK